MACHQRCAFFLNIVCSQSELSIRNEMMLSEYFDQLFDAKVQLLIGMRGHQ